MLDTTALMKRKSIATEHPKQERKTRHNNTRGGKAPPRKQIKSKAMASHPHTTRKMTYHIVLKNQ
jgi:hypothetical protein